MKDEIKRARVLGFSKLEFDLFETLTYEPKNISLLASELNRAHTSLYGPLRSLKKRGLIESIEKGSGWKRVNQESLISSLGSILFSGIENKKVHTEFFLHTGKKELVKIYYLLGEQKGERVFGIQPNESVKGSFGVFSPEEIIKINNQIKKNKVIIEAVFQENMISSYASFLKQKGINVEEVFNSFGGRSADTTYIPKDLLDFNSEIIILKKSAYIINWEQLVAIEIRNAETIGLLMGMFLLAKHFGSKVDQNALVAEYLENNPKVL